MDLLLSTVAEGLAQLEQKYDTDSTHTVVLKERLQPVRNSGYPSDSDSALSEDSLITGSKEEPRLSRRAA